MTNSDIKDNFINVFNQFFSYLSIEHKFMSEVPESSLNSIAEYNVLVGISGTGEGNLMFGFTKEIGLEIVNNISETKNIKELDHYAKSALADIFNDFAKRIILSANVKGDILYSSPTYISGNNMMAMISKVPATNLFFKLCNEKFSVSYYLENL